MRGNELFKVAVRSLEEVSRQVLSDAGLTTDDIDLFIPHQANQRITEAVRERLGVASEKVYSNISRVGNTSSASIPICLDECVTKRAVAEGKPCPDVRVRRGSDVGRSFDAVVMNGSP